MTHHIVVSNYQRNKRAEVLVIRDPKTDAELMHLHPGTNAVDTETWGVVQKLDNVAELVASGVLVDKGLAPEPPAPAEETTKPDGPNGNKKAGDGAGAGSSGDGSGTETGA